jgi:hypothetical protein
VAFGGGNEYGFLLLREALITSLTHTPCSRSHLDMYHNPQLLAIHAHQLDAQTSFMPLFSPVLSIVNAISNPPT